MIFASGSAGTHAGILNGVKAMGLAMRVEGIEVEKSETLLADIQRLAAETSAFLNLDLHFQKRDFILHDAYGHPGYGVITDAEREAIRLLASTEGIVVDPVYTGRALAGMFDLIRLGVYGQDETLLFWHTGGVAGLFARADEIILS
jgi:D-cysteine desulfhydrase